jgi:hypothetical protein
MQTKYVKKAAGDLEPFSEKKLRRFLARIEVPESHLDQIIGYVQSQSGDEIYSREIADLVTEQLQMLDHGEVYAARYNLKRDIRKMGPAGHIFEKYIGRLFETQGFDVKVGVIVHGECVEHEIDVYASKSDELHIVEAKFHNREGTRSDVTVALYVYARFLDVSEKVALPGHQEHVWIATNTKLSTMAFRYAACKGINILSVEQPHNNSIMDRVMREGLFPITSIGILHNFLDTLFRADVIVISDILKLNAAKASQLGLPAEVLNLAQLEAAHLLDFKTEPKNPQELHELLI